MRFHHFLTGLVTVFLVGKVSAAGVSIDPGMWEMTSTMTMSIMPEPRSNTAKECIQESELSPEDFNMDEDNPCNISDVSVDGNTARWSISCAMGGGPQMAGQWEFTSSGDTISGKGAMNADFNGQKMGFDMTWTGKRVGDCE